jgi:hypothetical protein
MTNKYIYRPSRAEACKAKCCECCANYDDGKRDCEHYNCPMYYRMPYAKHQPSFEWILTNSATKIYVEKYKKSGLDFYDYINTYIYDFDKCKLKIPLSKIMRAKCNSCCNNFKQPVFHNKLDGHENKGRIDCQIQNCSLYYWQPFRKLKPRYSWFFDLKYTAKHREYLLVHNITKKEYLKKILKRKIRTDGTFAKKNKDGNTGE